MGLFGRRKPKIDPALEAALDREAEPRLVLTQWPLREPMQRAVDAVDPAAAAAVYAQAQTREERSWVVSIFGGMIRHADEVIPRWADAGKDGSLFGLLGEAYRDRSPQLLRVHALPERVRRQSAPRDARAEGPGDLRALGHASGRQRAARFRRIARARDQDRRLRSAAARRAGLRCYLPSRTRQTLDACLTHRTASSSSSSQRSTRFAIGSRRRAFAIPECGCASRAPARTGRASRSMICSPKTLPAGGASAAAGDLTLPGRRRASGTTAAGRAEGPCRVPCGFRPRRIAPSTPRP